MISLEEIEGVKDFLYYKDVKEDIHGYLRGEIELIKPETTRFGYYDDHFKWLRSEVTGFSGMPNSGKSAFVNFLAALKMYYDKWKVCIYSPETAPEKFLFISFLHVLSGKNPLLMKHKPKVEFYAEFEKIIDEQLFVCAPETMPTMKGILERFKSAYEHHGVDQFILDPFNCLDREWGRHNRDDRYVAEFIDLYREFAVKTDTVCVVVMHPNARMAKAKNGIDIDVPTAYDLAGGAMWFNKLDNLIFVHRPNFISDKDDPTVLVRHQKIKKRNLVGSGGDVTVEFQPHFSRYSYMGFTPDFNNNGGQVAPEPIKNNIDFDGKAKAANDVDNDMPF